MMSERIQRRIERLLDRAEEAADRADWALSSRLASEVLLLDTGNADASLLDRAARDMLALSEIEAPQLSVKPSTEGAPSLVTPSSSKPRYAANSLEVSAGAPGQLLAGVDGCRAGWICVTKDTGSDRISANVFATASELVAQLPRPKTLMIDIPIGLVESDARICDLEARKLLGQPRGSSVFPAPLRQALDASSYEEAAEVTHSAIGKKISKQAWGIFPKVREVDSVLSADPELQTRVREVHPEVSFCAMNGGRPMPVGKKRREGKLARLQLVRQCFEGDVFEAVRDRFPRREVADDDILDAFAALFTAIRVANGDAVTLPSEPPTDRTGLRMEIIY